MFPITDSSETILNCFFGEADKVGIELLLQEGIDHIEKQGERFSLSLHSGKQIQASSLIFATGSSFQGWEMLRSLGHTITPPVPSLFTYPIPTSPLLSLSGIAVEDVEVSFSKGKKVRGPLLLTHWGFSGPAVLKLSAFEARNLHALNYHTTVFLNWAPSYKLAMLEEKLFSLKKHHPQATLATHCPISLPKNLWRALLLHWEISFARKVGTLPDKIFRKIAARLIQDPYQIEGKTTYKQEFVTCGGVALSEVDFQTMESRLIPQLYFAGEVLDIDGVTGGFNFQNAWTTGWIAGQIKNIV